MAVERAQAGFQLGFHAIGDKAAAMALDAYAQPGVSKTARNRIEHAQVVDPADIPRFAKLGVIASMQPNHLLTDMNWAEDRLGPSAPPIPTRGRHFSMRACRWLSEPTIQSSPSRPFADSMRRSRA